MRRRLPGVDTVLQNPSLAAATELYGRDLITVQIRAELESLRGRLVEEAFEEDSFTVAVEDLPQRVVASLQQMYGAPLRRVINATGIFLHTNLGRSPLPHQVATRLPGLLDAYCDLEYRLASGERGDRNVRVDRLLQATTGAEGGILVNNNAGALVLILSALASGKEVVVSRGELVEIGGSFRIPDILTAAGVKLIEVGTTNRTRVEDYERAITDRTGLLLKVYPSNYRQIGFTASVEVGPLVAVGRQRGVAVVVDEGSGLLRPNRSPQLRDHPSLSDLMEIGCDLACGSGDKLLGGPQAGLIVGRRESVDRCRRNALYRALRPDRFTFAGIEDVLRMHLAGNRLPLSRMWIDAGEHRERLERLAAELGAEIVAADGFLGGGSAPEKPIPGEALALAGRKRWLEEMRHGTPPVIGYIREGRLILDLRTVHPRDDPPLIQAVRSAQERS
jgi:L-seryl-tRNA(Ser) seleniumtransferase